MVAVLILLVIFGSITLWIVGPRWIAMEQAHRLKELELNPRGRADELRVRQLEGQRAELEERVRSLETIVCGVDLELNAKLNRLASRQLAMLPAAGGAGASGVLSGILEEGGDRKSAPDPSLAATQAVPKLVAGTRIADRFVIERSIGSGGMGTVYLARDEKLGESVALKVLRDTSISSEPEMFERFRREITSARRISHPNVVRLHDLGQADGILFISMEYVAGESLRSVLARQGNLGAELLRPLLGEVCDGLAAAHKAGVIHRDLKPENILVHGGRHAKIIDFGIAKLADLEGMTATRMILGTPQYMSPEQIRGLPTDARSDLYSLSIVAFEALTGKPPYAGGSPISVGFAHCNEPIPSARARRADVPAAWEAFVTRGLAKDAGQRFQSADEMRAAMP